MLFYIISFISAIIAGIGVGGGSIYILVITILNILDYKTAMIYNIIMFIIVGLFATINNIKNKNFDKSIFFKIIFLCFIGNYIGSHYAKIITEENLKKYFYIFMLVVGIYEIISSLISFKKGKI